MIEETFAYGLVIGCSLFGILWGLVNALLVSNMIPHAFDSTFLIEFTLNFCMFRSDKLIWKIIPILKDKMVTMSRNLSLIMKTRIVITKILVPF